MRLVPLVLLTLVVAVRADDAQNRELAYYRAWYTLTVEDKPESAKMWFEGVRKMEGLSAERDAACRLGLAHCEHKLGNTDASIKLLAALRTDVAATHELSRRIERLARRLGVGSHSGEFSICYKQGFNFRTKCIDDTENADLRFITCAGGISSVTFQADDKSTINDFGRMLFAGVVRDKDSDFHSLFRVMHRRDGVAVLLEWVSLQGDILKRCPALELSVEQMAALKKLLTKLRAGR